MNAIWTALEERMGRNPTAPLVHVGLSHTLSAVDLHTRASALAASLPRRMQGGGVRAGLFAENSAEWLTWFLALQRVGACTLLINPHLRALDLTTLLAKFNLTAMATSPTGDHLHTLKTMGLSIDGRASMVLVDLVAGEEVPQGRPTPPTAYPDHAASIVHFTSGTTAAPKGVVLTPGQYAREAAVIAAGQGLSAGDRLLSVSPFFHTAGLVHGFMACLVSDACLITLERYRLDEILAAVDRYRPTVQHGVSTLWTDVLGHTSAEVAGFRAIWITGTETFLQAVERRSGAKVCGLYGMTETTGCAALSRTTDVVGLRHQTIGNPLPGVDMRLASTGEMLVRGFNVMQGYLDEPALTGEAIDGEGWLHTGDVGAVDEAGTWRFVGRLKDLIRVGGENVAPAAIEDAILRLFPALQEACAFGVPDPRLGEVVGVAYVVKPGSPAPDFRRSALYASVAGFHRPRYVWRVGDIPRGDTGKPLRRVVQRQCLTAPSIALP